MIVSEIIEISKTENLTRNNIEVFFRKKNIIPVKWYVSGINKNSAQIFVAYEKKTL